LAETGSPILPSGWLSFISMPITMATRVSAEIVEIV